MPSLEQFGTTYIFHTLEPPTALSSSRYGSSELSTHAWSRLCSIHALRYFSLPKSTTNPFSSGSRHPKVIEIPQLCPWISEQCPSCLCCRWAHGMSVYVFRQVMRLMIDRKSTRLNSSHLGISY